MQSSARRVCSAQGRRERLRLRAPRGVKPAAIRVQVLFLEVLRQGSPTEPGERIERAILAARFMILAALKGRVSQQQVKSDAKVAHVVLLGCIGSSAGMAPEESEDFSNLTGVMRTEPVPLHACANNRR